MGETQQRPFQLSFNSSLPVDFQGAQVTSDSGLLLVRELDERLRLSETRGPALERFPPGQEYPIVSGRRAAAVIHCGWCDRSWRRRAVAQGRMRSSCVVVHPPSLGQHLRFLP